MALKTICNELVVLECDFDADVDAVDALPAESEGAASVH